MSNRRRSTIVLQMILVMMFVRIAAAENDVVVTKNGDRITGEIKKLDKGVIRIKPDYGKNTFEIEWKEIERIESKQPFAVETASGRRLAGQIHSDPGNPGKVVIETGRGSVAVELPMMVWAEPYNRDFWNRFSTSIDLGASVAKAAGSKQVNLNSTLGYLAEHYRLQGSFAWNRNVVGESRTKRFEANGQSLRLLGEKWFGVGIGDFLGSDELQLELRTTLAPGVGRFLKRSNRMYWNLAGGAQWTNEQFQDPTLPRNNGGEGWVQTELNAFDFGNLNLLTRLKVSPSFTNTGRIRLDFRSDLKYDLPKDLYVRFGLSDNFDNRPSGDAPRNDYVFSFGVGWEY